MPRIELGKGRYALVDEEDFERVNQWPWYAWQGHASLYAVRNATVNGKKSVVYMHRFILGAAKGQQVDHKNSDGLDNRRENIRLCSHAQNQRNQRKQKRKTSSVYKGVCWDKRNDKWMASITENNRLIYLGRFRDEKEAAQAYDKKAREIHGKFARLNFPNA